MDVHAQRSAAVPAGDARQQSTIAAKIGILDKAQRASSSKYHSY